MMMATALSENRERLDTNEILCERAQSYLNELKSEIEEDQNLQIQSKNVSLNPTTRSNTRDQFVNSLKEAVKNSKTILGNLHFIDSKNATPGTSDKGSDSEGEELKVRTTAERKTDDAISLFYTSEAKEAGRVQHLGARRNIAMEALAEENEESNIDS
jgi:hypothetical protein